MRRAAVLVALVALVAVASFGGCSGERPSLASDDDEPVATTEPGKVATLDERAVDATLVATSVVPVLAVYPAPGAAEPVGTLPHPLASGGPLVLLALRVTGEWVQVELPTSPPGTTGWVRAADVTVASHNYRIDLHLSELRLDVFLAGEVVRRIKVGLTPGSVPAAGGRYFTTELVTPATPDPVYGTNAYVLSGWADPLAPFTGAPGQLAIHGTSQPGALGERATVGSIRMRNEDVEELASFLPLGVRVNVSG